MPKFTKEELDTARLEGYTDQEIISHVAQGNDEVLNALDPRRRPNGDGTPDR